MSSELHVLFSGKVPTKAALTRAMKELGFPVTIPAGSKPLAQQSGYLPMKLRREESGVEVDVSDDRSVVEEIAGKHFDPRSERCVSFRWGGDEREMLCGQCTAAALAKLVDGIVRDDDGGHLSADQAIADARQSLSRVKPAEPRYGTRPADIKRYMKPLLELRSDLVLKGRLLLIRPLRHLLRGVCLASAGKHHFRLYPVLGLIHEPPLIGIGAAERTHEGAWKVWQPHFAPLLLDVLATDVFGPLGRVTTLDEVATDFLTGWHPAGIRWRKVGADIATLIVAGEMDRAAEFVQKFERETPYEEVKLELRSEWERLTADVDGLCAKLHAQEAELVKAWKLENIWEPSPFPVELPVAERVSRSADPAFSTTPWIAPPSWLWQKLPTEPGEVRFAKKVLRRGGDIILTAALSREEAEERHRALEDYVMVARLADGFLLLIGLSGWDRNDPEALNHVATWSPAASLAIELRGHSHVARARTSTDWDHTSVVEIEFVDVDERLHT